MNKIRLHFPSLHIVGFRGIDELEIPRLGRVTLITGKNGVGKSTVLEAVRIYAARARPSVIAGLLARREEDEVVIDPGTGEKHAFSPTETLLHNTRISDGGHIEIGTGRDEGPLQLESYTLSHDTGDGDIETIEFEVKFGTEQCSYFILEETELVDGKHLWPEVRCHFLGVDLLSNRQIVEAWPSIEMTRGEDIIAQMIGVITNKVISRIAVITDSSRLPDGRDGRVAIRFKDAEHPVPLRRLGDGVSRLFAVAISIIQSRDGVLLMDEAENGLHYSVHPDFWRMVLQIAQEYNVQVLATTHSWDCIVGFAQAIADYEEGEGVLLRLSNRGGQLNSVEYTTDELVIAAEQHIEVR